MMLVDPLISSIPKTEQERQMLRESIRNNELTYKTFVSDDFRYALIILKVKREPTIKK